LTLYPDAVPSVADMETTTARPTVDLDLYFDSDCPNADPVRTRLLACLAERDLTWHLREHRDADRLSPTLLVNGADVVPGSGTGTGCRLDVPGRDDICRALDDAEEAGA
jgi:hypothetical protein